MVGNRVFFAVIIIFFYAIYSFCSVELMINGGTQYDAVVGEQFTVDLVVKGIQKGFSEPTLKEIPHASVQRAGLFMSTINGKSETRYSYHVSFNEIGTYMLGPVTIQRNLGDIQSNMVSVTVSHGKQESNDEKQDLFLRLTTDTEEAVVGQTVICTLSCYVKRHGISINQVTPPRLTKAQLNGEKKVEESQEIINGVQYAVVRWAWEIIPSHPGEFVIPAAAIEYTTQSKNRGSFLFSLFADEKRIYSNACVINVSLLPAYNGPVHAIGNFSDFSASLSPTIIKQGEATTITVTIHGNGTFLVESPYNLQNMPSAIRHYVVEPKKNGNVYTFEYVVQGIIAGTYSIPEQIFTFFNTGTKQYEQLQTAPLELHITENTAFLPIETNEINNTPEDSVINESSELSSNKDQIGIQQNKNIWFDEYKIATMTLLFPEITMSWSLFLFFILFLLFIKVLFILFAHFVWIQKFVHQILFKIRVLIAILKLYRLEKRGDIATLHQLFIRLISYLYHCSKNDVYLFLPDLNNKLKQISKSSKSIDSFWQLLDRAVYYGYSSKEALEIFQQSWFWLKQFLKLKVD